MNYTERAKQLGFSAAAVMDTKNLVFKPEYRVFCEENRCGNYDRNPACPPESGSVEEMKEKALELLNDKQKLALFGHEARLNAEDYSYDSVKEKWLSIINDILN